MAERMTEVNVAITKPQVHTSALHIDNDVIVCTCGEMFVRHNLDKEGKEYVSEFSTHLYRKNAVHYD